VRVRLGRVRITRPPALTLLSAVLLVLLPTIALLQYRWVGQVSVAERERMQRNLRNAALQFREAFDIEVGRATLYLQVGPNTSRDNGSEQYTDRYDNWLDTAEHPQILAGIYIVDAPDAELRLRVFRGSTHTFEPAPWPEALQRWKSAFERERLQMATADPERRFERRPPLVEDDALLVAPMRGAFPPPRLRSDAGLRPPAPPFGFTVLHLDLDYIRGAFLASLAQRHFRHDDGDSYRVAVIADDGSGRVIYRSDPTAPVDPRAADASEPLFGTPFTRRANGRGLFRRENAGPFARLAPETATPPASRPGGPDVPDPDMTRSSEPPEGRWRLLVQHERGSLDQAVAAVRQRNLAISFGALLLLAGSIVLLAGSSRRAQRLAQQQMEFVAGVSHELRTPVAVIKSAAENLSHGVVVGDRVKKYGQVIGTEAQRLGDMIEQVLQYAAVESGAALAAQAALQPSSFIAAAVESATAAESGQLVIERDTAQDLPLVQGDAAALCSAVQNLVANAIKYGGGDRWVGIKARRQTGRSVDEVRIDVTDHGQGIPPAEIPHIFEPFYRGGDAVARQIRGSGLGLSLVRNIVTAHGGRVSVTSQAGDTTFTIVLPAMRAEADIRPLSHEAGAAARS
jgi:signal transduction histidine kinase